MAAIIKTCDVTGKTTLRPGIVFINSGKWSIVYGRVSLYLYLLYNGQAREKRFTIKN